MGGFKLNGETSVFMRTRTHFLWLLLFSAVVGCASHDVGETDLASFFARTILMVAGMRALPEVLVEMGARFS